jgi:hypothetical protein
MLYTLSIGVLCWEVVYQCTWYYIYSNCATNNRTKIATNCTSFLHALSVIIGTLFHFSLLQHISICYFIYDLLHVLFGMDLYNIRVMSMGFIMHHIVSIVALFYYNVQPVSKYLPDVFFYAEISNILTYVVYHRLHTNQHKYTTILQLTQSIAYLYIRVYVLFIIGYNMCNDPDVSIMIHTLWSVYIIGLVWGFKLFKQTLGKMTKLLIE